MNDPIAKRNSIGKLMLNMKNLHDAGLLDDDVYHNKIAELKAEYLQ